MNKLTLLVIFVTAILLTDCSKSHNFDESYKLRQFNN